MKVVLTFEHQTGVDCFEKAWTESVFLYNIWIMNKHDFAYNLRRIIELAGRSTESIGHEGDDCNIIKVIAEDMLRHCNE